MESTCVLAQLHLHLWPSVGFDKGLEAVASGIFGCRERPVFALISAFSFKSNWFCSFFLLLLSPKPCVLVIDGAALAVQKQDAGIAIEKSRLERQVVCVCDGLTSNNYISYLPFVCCMATYIWFIVQNGAWDRTALTFVKLEQPLFLSYCMPSQELKALFSCPFSLQPPEKAPQVSDATKFEVVSHRLTGQLPAALCWNFKWEVCDKWYCLCSFVSCGQSKNGVHSSSFDA